MLAITRQERGRMIVEKSDQIQRIDECKYRVASQSGKGFYAVVKKGGNWACKCPDHIYREIKCKHIWAVELSLAVRKAVQAHVIQPVTVAQVCVFCKSENIVRDGLRHNKVGDIQIWNCRTCSKHFTINLGFEKMRANPRAITSAMQLYFTGESLRNVQKFLRLQGVQVSHVAVYKWIQKYVALMAKYLEQIQPQVSDTWRADELFLKVRGNTKYLFAMLDDETRFWIAKEVTDAKNTSDVRPLFQQARATAGKKPMTLITDGAHNFHLAYMKEYWTQKGPKTQHIRRIRFQDVRSNNKMERFNGEIRDREKVMRGLKKTDTPIISGYQIYHNYMRPHEALDGKTPAEVAGIKVEGQDKWLTLIQNASHPPTVNSSKNPVHPPKT